MSIPRLNRQSLDQDSLIRDDVNLAHRRVRDIGSLITWEWDYVARTRQTLTDIWTYYQGGPTGTATGTITVTYETSEKLVLISAEAQEL